MSGISIQDHHDICSLLARYCHAMDASRGDLCIQLFSKDARLETPVGTALGIEAIQQWIDERLAMRSSEYQVGHYLLSPLLTPLATDRVRVRSMLLYTRQAMEGSSNAELLGTGIYEDVVRLQAGGWLFQSRHYQLDAPLDEAYFTGDSAS